MTTKADHVIDTFVKEIKAHIQTEYKVDDPLDALPKCVEAQDATLLYYALALKEKGRRCR